MKFQLIYCKQFMLERNDFVDFQPVFIKLAKKNRDEKDEATKKELKN